MIIKIKSYKFLILLLVLCACGGRNRQDEALLKEAAAIHNQMVILAETLEKKLETLQNDTTHTIPADSITAWMQAIKAWESDLVEVPGNEEHHHHEEGEHHHQNTPDVTAEQMLVIQKELNIRLEALRQRIEKN